MTPFIGGMPWFISMIAIFLKFSIINSIQSIPMSAGEGNGIATMTCFADDVLTQTLGDCSAGNAYVLEYKATVLAGDPSGFGGSKVRAIS